jgi:hypothetical protein
VKIIGETCSESDEGCEPNSGVNIGVDWWTGPHQILEGVDRLCNGPHQNL